MLVKPKLKYTSVVIKATPSVKKQTKTDRLLMAVQAGKVDKVRIYYKCHVRKYRQKS